ncbi:MAG TPA: hypothetical protein VM925_15525 [Labilithrix sp.]|nr:hypothetical protein [Labilithrix sp.]
MFTNATHPHFGRAELGLLRHLAVASVAVVAAGCGADVSPDAQTSGDELMEDTGPVEDEATLDERAQSLELDALSQPDDESNLIGEVCGVANVVKGISDSDSAEFELGQTDGTLTSGAKTSLFDAKNKGYVQYGKRSLGINLTWSSSEPKGNIELHKAGGGVINYGDKVAIRVNNGGFLKYGSRTVGINLNWVSSNTSQKPYEWEVRGGTPGTPVGKNSPVRLFNTVENDNLVYCRRPTGINLGWAKDCANIPGVGRVRTGYCPS